MQTERIYHLENNGGLMFRSGYPNTSRSDQESFIAEIALSIRTRQSLQEIDLVIGQVACMTIQKGGLFSSDVKGVESSAYHGLLDARDARIKMLPFDETIQYLVSKNDFFQAAHLLFQTRKNVPSCFSDHFSISDLSAIDQFFAFDQRKKTLDFTNVSFESVVNFLDKHNQYNSDFYTKAYEVTLSLSQEELSKLYKKQAFRYITFLDLKSCKNISWKTVEQILIESPRLTKVQLPDTLTGIGSKTVISEKIKKELFPSVLLQLTRICKDQELIATITNTKHMAQFYRLAGFVYGKGVPKGEINWKKISNLFLHFLFQSPVDLSSIMFPIDLSLQLSDKNIGHLVQKMLFFPGSQSLKLDYCSNLTRSCFQIICEKFPDNLTLSLFGCHQVDDAFFSPLPKLKIVDLRGTSVSLHVAQALVDKGTEVLYDSEFLFDFSQFKNRMLYNSDPIQRAHLYFKKTGYLPQLEYKTAKFFAFTDGIDDALKVHAESWLLLNMSSDNALELLYLSSNNQTLSFFIRFYIELFMKQLVEHVASPKEAIEIPIMLEKFPVFREQVIYMDPIDDD